MAASARPIADAGLDDFIQRGLEHVYQATRDLQGLVELLQMLQERSRLQAAALQKGLADAQAEAGRLQTALERERAASATIIADLRRRLDTADPQAENLPTPLPLGGTTDWRNWVAEAAVYARTVHAAPGTAAVDGTATVIPVRRLERLVAPASCAVTLRRVPDVAQVRALQAAITRIEGVTACTWREFAAGSLVLDVEYADDVDLAGAICRLAPFDLRLIEVRRGAIELQVL